MATTELFAYAVDGELGYLHHEPGEVSAVPRTVAA
jgi:hypothetical protein